MIAAAIEEWVWRSHAVLAASLSLDGTVRQANPALERLAPRPLAGVPLAELIEPSQHAALADRMAAAGERWRPAVFAFLAAAGRPSIDRRLWLARAGDELLVIGEPVTDEQERLVEKVLELNDELVTTHRELVRQRAAAEAGAERIRELLERERGIAETLQRALLPERLPAVPGVRLSALFEPAAGEVGGDWYDAVRLDSGELALAIGDVAGKGIPAATLMGELRGGLRAGVLDGSAPTEALRTLDRLAQRAGQMATVLLVLLDPETGALRHASAGHLPPLLVEPGGAVRFLEGGTAPPLLAYDAAVEPGTAALAPGARLILYTDGLVERRGESIDVSLGRLAEAAAGAGPELTDLVAAMLPPEGVLRDDIAVLAVERER